MRRASCVLLFTAATVILCSAQTFTKLADFIPADGWSPQAPLLQASDGNFYGMTAAGGLNNCFAGCGTVYKMTPSGTLTTLHSFDSSGGYLPQGGLIQATDGNLYGVTFYGGLYNGGTVFMMTLDGTLTTLYRFCSQGPPCLDGQTPLGPLVQASDGNFYGATGSGGGANQCGTLFKITPAGTLSTLYTFTGSDGCTPNGGLIQASDGNFYGTTQRGEANNQGIVYKLTPAGVLTTFYSFCSQVGCADGEQPEAGLVQATDGELYGSTAYGGPNGVGTLFKVSLAGAFTLLHQFCSQQNCSDGSRPLGALTEASDAVLYGTTSQGGTGTGGAGTLFGLSLSGALATLYNFCSQPMCADGFAPNDGLIQASDGKLYGTTDAGGANTVGTVFSFTLAPATLTIVKNGFGLVSSPDGHIYCGSVCSYSYFDGAHTTLSAVPAPGYTLTGWTGCDHVNGSYCSVTVTPAKNVTTTFTFANVTLTSLTFKPTYVKGGQLSAGTLTLSAAAPPGGVTVALSSDHPGVAHPPSFVFVPGGNSSVQFAVNTFPVKNNTTVTITAVAGSSQVSGMLTVGTTSLPPSIK